MLKTLTLFYGTPNIEDLLSPGGWNRCVIGHSNSLDIYGIHLTKSQRVAKQIGNVPGGGYVKVEVLVERIIYLEIEDIEKQSITLIRIANNWRKSDGSLLDIADGWVENALETDSVLTSGLLEYTHSEIVSGRMQPLNVRQIPINLLSETYCDAVVWPMTSGMVESEVTIFDPSRIGILKTFP